MAKRVKVADSTELQPGEGKSVQADGKGIALFNLEGEFYAIEDFCTHAGAPLGDGYIEGQTVACNWHGAQFDIKTGEALTPPAFGRVATFKVEVEDGEVFVELGE